MIKNATLEKSKGNTLSGPVVSKWSLTSIYGRAVLPALWGEGRDIEAREAVVKRITVSSLENSLIKSRQ